MKEIREQMVLNPDTVRKICEAKEFRVPIKCLTTDFLVTYKDGSSVAYSVKSDRKVLDKDTYRNPGSYEELLIRQYIEKCYWEQHGVDFRIVFSNELNTVMAQNVAACMLFYDRKYVTDTETKLKYLIAHKKIQIPMEQEILNFAGLAEAARDKLEELYTKGG